MGLPSTGRSRARRTAAAPRVEGRGTQPLQNGAAASRNSKPGRRLGMQTGRLEGCAESLGKVEIRKTKQSSSMLVNHCTLKDTSVAVKGLTCQVTPVPVFAAHSDSQRDSCILWTSPYVYLPAFYCSFTSLLVGSGGSCLLI